MRFCGHCGTPRPTAEPQPATSIAPPSDERPAADALRSFVTGQVADRLIDSGGELTEERRLVTALFADLSGFTPLSERLDPEELLEVIDPIIRTLSDIVGRYDGFVEKFAGDALLALFGAPVAHEDDAARAVLVAIEMHRELANLRAQLGDEARDLTLHIGINSGHGVARLIGSAVRTDYAVLGDSVILAQRLESAAPPNETYIGETTRRLVRDRFELELVGPLTLKGKSEPVPAYRVVGERAVGERHAVGEQHATPLIGREEEVNAVRAVLDALAAGTGGVVSVTGEPGVGKSRFTEEARLLASGHGLRWLEARCLSYGAGLAYWPFADLLRRVAGIRVDDPIDEAASALTRCLAESDAGDALPFFGRLLGLPDETGAATGLEPEAFRRGLHDAVGQWLRALTRDQPVVLALEDCHWADASSIALVLELARACREDRVLLYLTGRPVEGGLVDLLVGSDTPMALALRLQPLDAHGVAALTEYVLGGTPPPGLLPVLFDRGGGNPFFVEETVRALLDGGVLLRGEGRWDLRPEWDASAVPPTIEGVLAARLDALPSKSARLLGLASVIGRRVRMGLLRAVAAETPEVDASLATLIAAGLLDQAADPLEEAVVFHHALVQEVAYGRLIRRRRRDLHLRAADAAERLYGDGDDVIDLLARHLYLGNAGARAIDYLVRAGERARSLFANEEAIVHFSHAVELVRTDAASAPRLPEMLLTLADLHELRGAYDDARRLYEEVRDAIGDIRAWRGIASTLRRQGRYDEALASLDDAFAGTDGSADPRPLWLERGWNLSVAGRFTKAGEALEAGLGASSITDDAVAGHLLLQLARAESVEGRADEALGHALRARSIFEEKSDLRGLATALRVVGGSYNELGRYGDAATALRTGLGVAERVGSVEEIGGCLINLGFAEANRGNMDEAIACDRRAIEEFERIGHGSGRATGYANLADKLMRTKQYAEATRYGARALELAQAIGNAYTVADATYTLAAIRHREGDHAEAAPQAEEAARLFEEMGAGPSAANALQLAADAWEKAAENERARLARERAASLTAKEAAVS